MPNSSIWKSCISREIKRFCFTWLALSSKNIFATCKKWRFALNIKVIPWPNSLIYERSTWDVWFWHLFSFSVNLTMILPYILKLKDSTQIIWMLQGNKTKTKVYTCTTFIIKSISISKKILRILWIQCIPSISILNVWCSGSWSMEICSPKNVITCSMCTRQWFRCSVGELSIILSYRSSGWIQALPKSFHDQQSAGRRLQQGGHWYSVRKLLENFLKTTWKVHAFDHISNVS